MRDGQRRLDGVLVEPVLEGLGGHLVDHVLEVGTRLEEFRLGLEHRRSVNDLFGVLLRAILHDEAADVIDVRVHQSVPAAPWGQSHKTCSGLNSSNLIG